MADPTPTPRRNGPDPLALIGGLIALGIAGTSVTDLVPGWDLDLRWVLALVAVVAGVVFLLASRRNPRDDSGE